MGPLKPEALRAGCTVALDTDVLIYFLERHPIYHDTARRLLRRIETAEVRGTMSALVFTELLVPAYGAGDLQRANSVLRLLTSFPNLEVQDLTPRVSAEAARLRAQYGLRTPDAIHAAAALGGGADGIVTNDRDLLKVAGVIPVWRFEAD